MSARGVTLLEMVVSSAVLALLVLVVAGATIPLQRQAGETVLLVDQDERARRIMDPIRRELRQSGWNNDLVATPMFTIDPDGAAGDIAALTTPTVVTGAKTLISFRVRTGLGTNAWGPPIKLVAERVGDFEAVPGTIPEYRLLRVADMDGDGSDDALELARGISDMQIEHRGAQYVYVRVQLTDPDPRRLGDGVPEPLQRDFFDQIELFNGARN